MRLPATRPARRVALAGACAFVLSVSCGKRGDPLPPLRKTPLPVTGLRVAQRGDRIELTCTLPRTTTEGVRLPVLEVEILRADTEGEFAKLARRHKGKAAPGETLTESEPLPPPGTTLRFAARAVSKGHPSVLSAVAALTVQAPAEAPSGLEARLTEKGVKLGWTPPAHMPTPPPTPLPSPTAAPSPALTPPPSPSPGASAPSPGPSPRVPPPAVAPVVPASPVPGAAPMPSASPTPSPSPTPPPITTGFWVYRRGKHDSYGRPLQATPLSTTSFDDPEAPVDQTWCYAVRTVASTDPVVESADSNEACLEVRDIAAPTAPTGVTALTREGALEISWSPSPEADLESYRVYRTLKGAPPERLSTVPASETTYRDTTAVRGVGYLYSVAAVDKAANESPHSPAAPGRLE